MIADESYLFLYVATLLFARSVFNLSWDNNVVMLWFGLFTKST